MKRPFAVQKLAVAWSMLLLLAACAPGSWSLDPPPEEDQPSNTYIPPPGQPFRNYVEAAQDGIDFAQKKGRLELDDEARVAAGPFELPPDTKGRNCNPRATTRYDKGALLIHGLSGTPQAMLDLAGRFVRACYLVRALLLPGHGTVQGDLRTRGLADWRHAIDESIRTFSDQAERLVLVGYDLGATLALDAVLRARLAADAGQPSALPASSTLDGLVLIAPAFHYHAETFAPDSPPRQSGAWQTVAANAAEQAWRRAYLAEDPARFQLLAGKAIADANVLGEALLDAETPRHVPLFMVLSAEDTVIDSRLAAEWFCAQRRAPRQLRWYSRYELGTPSCWCPKGSSGVAQNCVIRRPGSHGRTIIDISHRALLTSPRNPRYGDRSHDNDCRHYAVLDDRAAWQDCNAGRAGGERLAFRYGEISNANLEQFRMARLTFNPDFDEMAKAILAFIDQND
jgi:alpha-beta hydrolase superfamily lysophospholipase